MNKDIGLEKGKVKLKKHNQNWVKLFSKEKELLLKNFPNEILKISHGGSTSIPNIPAKPIIDMFAIVPSLKIAKKIKEKIKTLNYHYRGEDGVLERILYSKGTGENVTHHLQLVEKESSEWENHLLIKNYYLNHPKVAEEYAKLKEILAKKYFNDRKSYSHGKDSFIKSVITKAKLENKI